MAFPPAHMLVGVGFADVAGAVLPLPKWRARLAAAALAVLPDLDVMVGLVGERAGSAYHGTFTHSVFATVMVGVIGWLVAGRPWAILAGTAYASHLLVDLLDDRGRTNILLGWPFSLEQPHAIGRIFPAVHFEQGRGAIAAALSLFEPPALEQLAIQTLVGAAMLLLLLVAARLIRRARSRPLPTAPA